MEKITITSSDSKFLIKLIDWLNKQKVEPNSTIISTCTVSSDDVLEIYEEKLDVETADWINKC